jgi:hypothetical protein
MEEMIGVNQEEAPKEPGQEVHHLLVKPTNPSVTIGTKQEIVHVERVVDTFTFLIAQRTKQARANLAMDASFCTVPVRNPKLRLFQVR